MTESYESPEVKTTLSEEEIRKRYQDTSLIIFKENQSRKQPVNYLSYGPSRRTMEYSRYGNEPVLVHRRVRNDNKSSQVSRIHQKSQDGCVIN